MISDLGSTSTPYSLVPVTPPLDLRTRRDIFVSRRYARHPHTAAARHCHICDCTDLDPCAGGCGWSRTGPGEPPMCMACFEFRKELEAYVEDGRVPMRGLTRLYRDVRARIQARRLAELEAEAAPQRVRRVVAGGR
jgi:hypothetical protein